MWFDFCGDSWRKLVKFAYCSRRIWSIYKFLVKYTPIKLMWHSILYVLLSLWLVLILTIRIVKHWGEGTKINGAWKITPIEVVVLKSNVIFHHRDLATVSPKGKYTLLSSQVLKTKGGQMKSRGCAKHTIELVQTEPSLILKFKVLFQNSNRWRHKIPTPTAWKSTGIFGIYDISQETLRLPQTFCFCVAIFWNYKMRLGPIWTNAMLCVEHPHFSSSPPRFWVICFAASVYFLFWWRL